MNKKIIRPVSISIALLFILSCSLAYFTDRLVTQIDGTAGTVAISVDNNVNFLDAKGQNIINPGDKRNADFTVTNEGNKSTDIRATVALTVLDYKGDPINFTGNVDNQSEYDLYLAEDIEYIEGEGYRPKEGAIPLQIKSVNDNTIIYELPEYVLNGNSDRYTEYETVDGVTEFSHTHNFVMVMKGDAGNEWQNSSVKMDILVEAKQHENTQAGWNIISQESIITGSINKAVVKEENVITKSDGSINNSGSTPAEPEAPPVIPDEPVDERITVTFNVVDEFSSPLTNVDVTLNSTANSYNFTTDGNGHAVVQLLPGEYTAQLNDSNTTANKPTVTVTTDDAGSTIIISFNTNSGFGWEEEEEEPW